MRRIAVCLMTPLLLGLSGVDIVHAVGNADGATVREHAHDDAAHLRIVLTLRKIWVGRTRGTDLWRCHVRVGDVTYMSADRTEERARDKLRPYASRYIYCRPIEPFVFGG